MSTWPEKKYDLIILGASGFTGRRVAREAIKFLNAPNSPLKSLALAGRSPARLSVSLNWALSGAVPPPEIPLIAADAADPDSLSRLAAQAKLILNCVGPFALHGRPVLEACVGSGCDYIDICGEPDFMETTEARFHEEAVGKGSLVISACGFDSVPADLGMMFHSKQWADAAAPNHVEAYLCLESEKRIVMNSATFETAVLAVTNMDKFIQFRNSRPVRAQPKIPGPPPAHGSLLDYHKELDLWSVPLPSCDTTVVPRTLIALTENPQGLPGVNETAQRVQKRERFWSSVKPAHFGVKFGSKSMLSLLPLIVLGKLFVRLSLNALGRWFLLNFPWFFSFGWFSKKGPSDDKVASASFKMWFVGRGFSDEKLASRGDGKPDTEVITRVMGPEIGYHATPIIIIQCVMILLADRGNLPKGGVYTPGIVFGPTDLQERLQENGISFDFISKKAISSEK